MFNLKTLIRMGGFAALIALGACSQSKKSLLANQRAVVLWEKQSLCDNSTGDFVLGCFEVQINFTDNFAYFDVLELGFDAGNVPYRIMGRRVGESVFHVLADEVTVGAGGTIEVNAKAGHYIEDYEEWRVELTQAIDANGLGTSSVGPGKGQPIVQGIIDWPELYLE